MQWWANFLQLQQMANAQWWYNTIQQYLRETFMLVRTCQVVLQMKQLVNCSALTTRYSNSKSTWDHLHFANAVRLLVTLTSGRGNPTQVNVFWELPTNMRKARQSRAISNSVEVLAACENSLISLSVTSASFTQACRNSGIQSNSSRKFSCWTVSFGSQLWRWTPCNKISPFYLSRTSKLVTHYLHSLPVLGLNPAHSALRLACSCSWVHSPGAVDQHATAANYLTIDWAVE